MLQKLADLLRLEDSGKPDEVPLLVASRLRERAVLLTVVEHLLEGGLRAERGPLVLIEQLGRGGVALLGALEEQLA